MTNHSAAPAAPHSADALKQQCRTEFEAWAQAEGNPTGRYTDGEYVSPTCYHWLAWQAAWNRRPTPASPAEGVTFRADRVIASLDFALTGIHGKDAVRLILTHRHGSHNIAMHREAASFIKDALDRAAAPPAQGLPAAPETCQCPACLKTGLHASDCAVHNAPAYPNGPCDCRAPAAAPSEPTINQMCERKTDHIMERDAYVKTGYVLRKPGADREVCVSDGGAVSWFTLDQWNWLMFNRDHVEFAWPKPHGAAPSITSLIEQHGSILSAANEQSRLAAAPSEPVAWHPALKAAADVVMALPLREGFDNDACKAMAITANAAILNLATPPAQDAGTGVLAQIRAAVAKMAQGYEYGAGYYNQEIFINGLREAFDLCDITIKEDWES